MSSNDRKEISFLPNFKQEKKNANMNTRGQTEKPQSKSTARAVPYKSCSPANPSWLGDFDENRSSLEILAV